jgi:hypothetical protein
MLVRNLGGGNFAPAVEIIGHVGLGFGLPADFNGDGNSDIAIINPQSSRLSGAVGDGSGAFPTTTSYATSASLNHLAVADLNNDDRIDIVGSGRGVIYTAAQYQRHAGAVEPDGERVGAAKRRQRQPVHVDVNVTNNGPDPPVKCTS